LKKLRISERSRGLEIRGMPLDGSKAAKLLGFFFSSGKLPSCDVCNSNNNNNNDRRKRDGERENGSEK